ncbi:MAG: GHKL domain-containing protein, partial [Bacilli bacterium]|nr:GHKL domain-containing protein [Bacilli bacterium]
IYDYNMVKLLIDFLSVILSMIIVFILQKYYRKIISIICNFRYSNVIFIFLFYINIFISIIIRYKYIEINNSTIVDCIVIITLIFIFVYSLDKNDKLQSLSNCYNEICDYSKSSEELNYDYRMKIHENKNQLLLIRSMVRKSNKKLITYIDNLLDLNNKDVDNSYLSILDKLNIPGLKNFINYKLMVLRKMNAKIELYVSDDVLLIDTNLISDNDYYNMTTIIGVLMDNIIDCLNSQKEKLASIIIYVEDNNLCFKFANNIEKNVDLNLIYNKGFSTKSSNRGVGLNLIKDIVDNNKRFECNTSIIDNFFVQDVIIKIPKIIF